MDGPPTPKYRFTVTIDASSHEEIESELLALANSGYFLDSQAHSRDEFHCLGGKVERQLEHTNPASTPEQYRADLSAWWRERKRHPASPNSEEATP
jgi:hypothetical protein